MKCHGMTHLMDSSVRKSLRSTVLQTNKENFTINFTHRSPCSPCKTLTHLPHKPGLWHQNPKSGSGSKSFWLWLHSSKIAWAPALHLRWFVLKSFDTSLALENLFYFHF